MDWAEKQASCKHENVDAVQIYGEGDYPDQFWVATQCKDCEKVLDD